MASSRPPRTRALAARTALAVLAAGALVAGLAAPAAASPAGSVAEHAARAQLAAEPQVQVPGFDVDRFQNPTDQKPAVLWFWDKRPTEAEIDARLESIDAAGFTEVLVFRWFGDGAEPYFSEAWFDRVEHLLAKSQELGLTIWLNNDDKFPSGAAGGFIVDGGTVGDSTYEPRPELAAKTLAQAGSAVRDGGSSIPLPELFGSSLRIEEGRVIADASSAPGITLLRDGSEWTDYSIDATFTIAQATAGFMVRSADDRNGYLVDVRSNGIVDIWRQTNGSFTNLRFGQNVRPGFVAGNDHEITISVEGSRISVTLDGVSEPDLVDAAHATGGFGMRVDGTQSWRLDHLAITSLPDSGPLYDNDFSDYAAIADFATSWKMLENVVTIAARPASGDGAADPAQVVDLTDVYLGGGSWDAPAGQWRIEAYQHVGRTGDHRNYIDSLDPEAQRLYNEIILDEYAERFGEYFGTTLAGFADDESEAGRRDDPRPVWSPALGDRIADDGGNLAAMVSSVFNDLGPSGTTMRAAYYRAASDQWVDAYWKPKYEWSEQHGIDLISNPLYDEFGPAGHLHESGNIMNLHQWAQIPGTDLISDHIQLQQVRYLPREPASVAHQLGRPLVYDELMGATGWHIGVAEVRQGTAMSAVRGINKALFHATFDDNWNAFYPPVFAEENTWWRHVPQLTTWTGRLMEFGRHTTAGETALVQMQRAAEAAQRGDEAAVNDPYQATQRSLEDSQIDFDIIDEGQLSDDPEMLAHAVVTPDGGLTVGEMTYRAVVVPSAPLVSLEAMQRLLEFVEAGGQVVFSGPIPARELERRDAELAETIAAIRTAGGDRVVATDAVEGAGAAAAGLGRAAVELADANASVRVLRFQEGETTGFMLHNEGASPFTTEFTFPAAGVPVEWDPETGDVTRSTTYRTDGDTTTVSLTLDPMAPIGLTISPEIETMPHALGAIGPGTVEAVALADDQIQVDVRSERTGATIVTATDGTRELTGAVVTPELPAALPLGGDWTMQLGDGSEAVTRPLESWTDLAPRYSGEATYTRSFEVTEEQLGADWSLDLGRVSNAAEITINGERLDDLVQAPYRVDAGDLLVAGTNTIEIVVTNTDANSRGNVVDAGLLGPVALTPFAITRSALVESGVEITAAEATLNTAGDLVHVTTTVHNGGEADAVITAAASGDGWAAGAGNPVTVPVGQSAVVTGVAVPTGFVDDGIVRLTATASADGQVVAALPIELDARFPTPPEGPVSDHVDLGDGASESAHNLQASPTSGTNVEAGLTRRYAGWRVADAWYEVDLKVEAGKAFVLQGLETYDHRPQVKGYHVTVDGELVATRAHVRDRYQAGTAAWRLIVPAEHVGADTVTVRFQSSSTALADPSLADVWATPLAEDTTAPVVTATVASTHAGDEGWHRGPATVSVAATDDRPGALAIEVDAGAGWVAYDAPFAVSAEGETAVGYRATDASGNTSEPGVATVRIDTIAPETDAEVEDEYAAGVAIAPATVALSATDAGSGVAGTRFRVDGGDWQPGSSVALDEPGDRLVEYSTTDVAGNEGAIGSLQVTVLAEAPRGPVVSVEVSEEGRAGWHLGGAQATLTATAGTSDVEAIEVAIGSDGWAAYTAPIDLADGETTIRARAIDVDGLIGPTVERAVRVDADAPTGWGWLSDAGRVATVSQDSRSGAGLGEYSLDGQTWVTGLDALVAAQPRPESLVFRAVDAAGNRGEALRLERTAAPSGLEVRPGWSTQVEASGFVPGHTIRVELHSEPVVLGTGIASAHGVIGLNTVVPDSVPAGAHDLVFVDTAAAGGGVTPTIPVDVLPSTGTTPVPLLLAAVLALLLGALALILRRRRAGTA